MSNYILTSSVLFEKCSKKQFILNSEKFLNSKGIAIFIFAYETINVGAYTITHYSVNENCSLSFLMDSYGIDEIYNLYYNILLNERLFELKDCIFNLRNAHLKNNFYENNSKKYKLNNIFDKEGNKRNFHIHCMSKIIGKKANFSLIKFN